MGRRIKICVADDEPVIAEVLCEGLRAHNFEAVEAHSGQEALDICKEGGIDLILLDINMPGIQGDTMANLLIRTAPELTNKIVLWSGIQRDLLEKKASATRVAGYISKDFGGTELATQVARYLERAPKKPTRSYNVLMVDDDRADYYLTQKMLEEFGHFTLDWARNFGDGVKAIMTGQHDAALVDYKLSGRTGLDLMKRISSEGIPTPMVLLTGYPDKNIRSLARDSGAVHCLDKENLTPATLDRVLRYVIAVYKS